MIGRLSRMSVSGRESLADVVEWSECHPGILGVVGMSVSGREALLYVRGWSGGPSGCPGVV